MVLFNERMQDAQSRKCKAEESSVDFGARNGISCPGKRTCQQDDKTRLASVLFG